MGLNPVPT